MAEYVYVVDDNDIPTGFVVAKKEVHEKGLLHRHSAMFIKNPDYGILLQESAEYGYLTFSAGGHCILGESYKTAAIREGKEELGRLFRKSELKDLGKIRLNSGNAKIKNNGFIQLYGLKTDMNAEDFKINPEEVKSVCFMPIERIEEVADTSPSYFSPSFRKSFLLCKREICKF